MELQIAPQEGVSIAHLTTGKPFEFLKKYALRLSRGDAMFADDIVQNVLIKAMAHPPVSGILRWLKVTAYNHFADTMRRDAYHARKMTNLQVMATLDGDYDNNASQEESGFPRGEDTSFVELDGRLADELYAPGAKVSPDQAALFAYVYLFDATYQEAAEQFGLPVGTIMSRLHHIRKKLASSPGVAELAREYGIATDNKRTRGNRCVWGRKIDVSAVQ